MSSILGVHLVFTVVFYLGNSSLWADMGGKYIQGSWMLHVAISQYQVAIAKAVAMPIPNPWSISFAVLLVLVLCSFMTLRVLTPVATI